jgi:hypothetical protein
MNADLLERARTVLAGGISLCVVPRALLAALIEELEKKQSPGPAPLLTISEIERILAREIRVQSDDRDAMLLGVETAATAIADRVMQVLEQQRRLAAAAPPAGAQT